jgi:hypothetical protein
MLKGKTKHVARFYGDGTYGKFGFRAVLGDRIEQIIPPPKNVVIQKGKEKGKQALLDYLK